MKILFSANNRTSLNGMVFLIEMLTEHDKNIEPVLVCQKSQYESKKYKVINFDGKKHSDEKLGVLSLPKHSNFYNLKGKKLINQLSHFMIVCAKMMVYDIKAKRIISDVNPDYLIISDDRVVGIQLNIIKYAKMRKIPIIMVSVCTQNDYKKDGFADKYFDYSLVLKNECKDINHIQYRYGNSQVLTYNNEKRVFFPTYCVVAMSLFRVLPRHPWVSGASFADVICAYSEQEKKMILDENNGIEITVTGMVEDEYILSTIKKKNDIKRMLFEKYNVDKANKLVLLSMPQLAEHNMVDWNVHRSNMRLLLKKIVDEFGICLISLHPKSRKEDYVYLENDTIKIISEKLRDVIVAVDIYICLDSSSTVHFAQLLGIPGYDLSTHVFLDVLEENVSLKDIGIKRSEKKDCAASGKLISCIIKKIYQKSRHN